MIRQNTPSLQSVAQDKNCATRISPEPEIRKIDESKNSAVQWSVPSSGQLPFACHESLMVNTSTVSFTLTFSTRRKLSDQFRSRCQPLYPRYSTRTGRLRRLTGHFWDKNKCLDHAGNGTTIPCWSCPLPSNTGRHRQSAAWAVSTDSEVRQTLWVHYSNDSDCSIVHISPNRQI